MSDRVHFKWISISISGCLYKHLMRRCTGEKDCWDGNAELRICFSHFWLRRAALSFLLTSPVDTSPAQKIHANLLCHNPHNKRWTTHSAVKVPGWDLNLTDPCTHQSNLQKEMCICLVCIHECACATERRDRKVKRRRRRTESSLLMQLALIPE